MKNNDYYRIPLTSSVIIEFDIKTANNVNFIAHNSTVGNRTVGKITSGFNEWQHVRIEYNSSTKHIATYIDDVLDTASETDLSGSQGFNPRIIDFNYDMDLTFKNFRVYTN